jgi:probable rRNA maturation factor
VAINFFNEDIKYNFPNKRITKSWIKKVIENYNFKLGTVNYIFCSDAEILRINNEFLKHNYLTDIITFPYTENNVISADIYICIPTVLHNSQVFNQPFSKELNRVIVHGVLHLVGFDDTTEDLKQTMRNEEDLWLNNL